MSWNTGLHGFKDGSGNLLSPHFKHNRKDIFHYGVFGHALATFTFDASGNPVPLKDPLGQPISTSGFAEFYGADFMVTLGLWRSDDPSADQTGTWQQQAGTLMHELGHTLGLFHG